MNKVFWNKVGSDSEVDNSELGPDGSRTGTIAYAAAKFNNGVDGFDGSNYVSFANAAPSMELITFDFWYKPGYGWESGGAKDIFNNGFDPITSWGFYCYYNGAAGISCAMELPGKYVVYTFPVPFASGDLFHIGIILNSAGAAGARMRLFKDGVEIEEESIVNDSSWTLGERSLVLAPVMGTGIGIVDDFVIWDDVKTDFSDRIYEGRVSPGPEPSVSRWPHRRIYVN